MQIFVVMERIALTNDEKIDGMDAIIEDLVEWELSNMDYASLQEFFINNMTDFYKDDSHALELMLEYRKIYTDTEIVLDEEARELARQQDNG